MKTDIHPDYQVVTVTCSCGNTFETRSTTADLRVELCSECHPFYTGKQKLVDTGGRIDRFERRFGKRKRSAAAIAADEVTTDEVTTDEVTTDEVTTDEVTTDEVTTDEVTTDEVTTDEVTTDEVATDEVTAATE